MLLLSLVSYKSQHPGQKQRGAGAGRREPSAAPGEVRGRQRLGRVVTLLNDDEAVGGPLPASLSAVEK
jgi:hypothetical protein